MWLYHSRLFILSHRWWANKMRVVLIIVSGQFHIWLVTIFLYRVQVQVPILPFEDIPSADMIDVLVAQHFNSCGLGGFLAPTGAQASPAFTNAQFTQPRQVSRALWGGGGGGGGGGLTSLLRSSSRCFAALRVEQGLISSIPRRSK